MADLSFSRSVSTGPLQPPANHHHHDPVSNQHQHVQQEHWCKKSTMVKFSIVVLIASFVLIITIFATYGEPQNEQGAVETPTTQTNRTRVRKLTSAVRKKKPGNGKLRAEVTTPIPTTIAEVDSSEIATSTQIATSQEMIVVSAGMGSEPNEEAVVVSTTAATTRVPKTKKPSQRQNPPLRTGPAPPGCGECDQDECNTPSESNCPTGLVLDRCSCCHICGALEGNRCYNASLNLPYNPEVGVCGLHLDCLLRSDLDPSEPREALCECRDKRIVCGSDRQTYLSECKLREAAHSKPGLFVTAWSPCVSGPVMTTPVENATVPIGEDVSLSCEVRGFPAPILHWEFKAEGSNGSPLILPGDDSGIVVVVRGGPEQIMTTSWIQIIAVDPKRQGTYFCVAKNTEGMTQAAAQVQVYKGVEDE